MSDHPFLTDLPLQSRFADNDDTFRLIAGRQRWAWAHVDEQAAYAEWIRGHTVRCVCDEPITRTTWTGARARLDPLEEPEGTWSHDGGDGSIWDEPASHITRPLLHSDLALYPSPPCAVHSQARHPYQPPAGRRSVFGPALTGPFDTRGPLFDRLLDWAWSLFDRYPKEHP